MLKLAGSDTAVAVIKMAVETVKSPILTHLEPVFRKTAVVIAMARKMNALALSLSCIPRMWVPQRPPCQLRNKTQEVKKGNGRAVKDASSQSCRTTLDNTEARIHREKGT